MKRKKSLYRTLADQVSREIREDGRTQDIRMDRIVRTLRKDRGMAGVELCRRAGDLDPKTLTALEKGRIRNPSIRTLQSLARGFGMTVSDLFREGEMSRARNLHVGGQKGEFSIDFPRRGVRIISFTPLIRDFFCGKITLGSRIRIDETLMDHPVPVFISVLVGRLRITVEGVEHLLHEGENIFFNGAWKHTFQNAQHRESSFLIVMAPSFLK